MKSLLRFSTYSLLISALTLASGCSKPAEEPAAPETSAEEAVAPAEAGTPLTTFADAETAAAAMVEAVRTPDREALAGMFGIDLDVFVPPDDIDQDDVDKFLAQYDTSNKLVTDASGKTILAVGEEEWTFPIPIVQNGGAWVFDIDAGREEMTIRRIGRNELAVIQTALAYCDAQFEYAHKDRNGDGLLEYAQKIISTEGQHDGLYWPGEGADLSPLGPLLADDASAGEPYHGYRYRILTAQGAHAPGGARSYILGDRMSAGFGLVAWPAAYGDTGIMTFIVNHEGKVYQKDLGDDTETAAAAITSFDPDDTWKEASPEATL